MARYQLTGPHYLNVPGNNWEYKEVDRTTGREKRHLREVPMFLHPEDQSCWNYITDRTPAGQIVDGHIVVTTKEDPNFPKDILFVGAPTMDMIPLDAEAKVAIAELQGKWKHPVMDIPGNFAEQLPQLWLQQLEAANSKRNEPPTVSTRELDELRKQNTDMVQRIAELAAIVEAIAQAPAQAPQTSVRRSL